MLREVVVTVVSMVCTLGVRALADPPVPFPAGTDLDSNGAFETEYSAISQEFIAPAIAGRIGFDWQLFTSESFGGAEDVFYVRLIDVASCTGLDEVNRAIDTTPAGYTGSFTPLGAPPLGTTGSSEAPAGGFGLMYDAFHLDGGTGWTRSFLSFPSAQDERALKLEMLVADAVDPNADTSLAIDNIKVLASGPIASLTNPNFEAQLSGWNTEGNVGVYTTLDDLFLSGPEPGTGPTDGKLYALISTAGRVPEPSSVCLLGLACAAIVALARRG